MISHYGPGLFCIKNFMPSEAEAQGALITFCVALSKTPPETNEILVRAELNPLPDDKF